MLLRSPKNHPGKSCVSWRPARHSGVRAARRGWRCSEIPVYTHSVTTITTIDALASFCVPIRTFLINPCLYPIVELSRTALCNLWWTGKENKTKQRAGCLPCVYADGKSALCHQYRSVCASQCHCAMVIVAARTIELQLLGILNSRVGHQSVLLSCRSFHSKICNIYCLKPFGSLTFGYMCRDLNPIGT